MHHQVWQHGHEDEDVIEAHPGGASARTNATTEIGQHC